MRFFEEVWNQRNVEAIDDMFATDQPDGSWLFAIDNPYGTEHGFG